MMPGYVLTFAKPIEQSGLPYPWLFLVITAVLLLGTIVLAIFLLRRMFGGSNSLAVSEKDPIPREENAPAFMTASMQAVILKLREQEKELERLHRAERERAENTARLSEEVTRNMPAGLLIIGANGLITGTNPAAEQALGIQGLLFRRYSEALGESSALTTLIQQCLADGKIFRREQAAHVAPDGSHHELGVTISPIRRAKEKATGAICLLSDLTELSSLQKQMHLRENLAALGELSAGIAHEFKNALATISGYAQMIHSDPSAPDTMENAAKILDQTRNVTHVVTEFLRYARPLDISEEPVALQPLLERIALEIRELQPRVQIHVEGSFSVIAGDEGLLRQAFLNLARNAAEAATSHSSAPTVILRGETLDLSGDPFQGIRILDNGPGIAPDALPKLFLPFFTTKVNGTGLGLAVVQKILVQHGGQIEARNRPGKNEGAKNQYESGAEFIVTLPTARAISEAVESKEVTI